MNKAKKILALLMALCMAFGVLTVSAYAGNLQAEINAAAKGATISWSGTSGPVVISKDITINFADGATVWSSEAKPAITIADGAKVTLNGVTAGVTSYDNFDNYDAMDLFDAYLAASVPAIRVGNNAVLNLSNAVVTGGEAKFVSTDIYVPVGAGVETYNNSVVNIENSVVFGTWGVENTSSTVVNIGPTSIVAGYMDATNALYRTNVVGGDKLTSKQFAEAFLNDEVSLDDEQTNIVNNLLNDRLYAVVEAAPEAVTGLTSKCKDGTALISFDADDTTTWVPATMTVNGVTKDLTRNGDKYQAVFEGLDTGDYNYVIGYKLRVDLGEAATTINDFIEDFKRDYWPDLNDNVNDAIDHILEVAADEVQPKLVDAYQFVLDFINNDLADERSPLNAFYGDFAKIKKELHYIIGDTLYKQIEGYDPEVPKGVGSYFKVLNYFEKLKTAAIVDPETGEPVINPKTNEPYSPFVAKAAYIRDNYQALWNDISGTTGDTLYVHVKNIYDILAKDGMIAQMQSIINDPANAALIAEIGGDDEFNEIFQTVDDTKALLKDVMDAIDDARPTYNEVIGGTEFSDYIAFATNDYLAEGDRIFSNIDAYYGPDFEGTKLLVKEAEIVGLVNIQNKLSIKTEVSVTNEGTVIYGDIVIDGEYIVRNDETFTLKAENGEDYFLFWQNKETGKVWSYDEEITITPVNDKSLIAFFSTDDAEWYINENGVPCDTPDAALSIYNGTLTFKEWALVAEKGDNIKVYKAVYEVSNTADAAFTVEVGAGAKIWDKANEVAFEATTQAYKFKEVAYVVADDAAHFKYWKDQNGNVVSYYANYAFVVTRNVTLTAEYSAAAPGTVALNTYFMRDNDGNLNVFAERSVSDKANLTIVEVGLLLTTWDDVADEDIKVGAARVSRAVDKVTAGAVYSANGTYWAVIKNGANHTVDNIISAGRAIRARAYIVCRDNSTGALLEEPIYSTVETF